MKTKNDRGYNRAKVAKHREKMKKLQDTDPEAYQQYRDRLRNESSKYYYKKIGMSHKFKPCKSSKLYKPSTLRKYLKFNIFGYVISILVQKRGE